MDKCQKKHGPYVAGLGARGVSLKEVKKPKVKGPDKRKSQLIPVRPLIN